MQKHLVKGQMISEKKLWCLKIFQKSNDIIVSIFALGTKMGQIKKVKAHYHANLSR